MNDATIVLGGSIQLYGSYNGTDADLTWSSSDSNVATVSNTGLVNVIDNESNIGQTVIITANNFLKAQNYFKENKDISIEKITDFAEVSP